MKYFVAVTDKDWFTQLAAMGADEVNFWRPGLTPFRALSVGSPLLFKLHSPENYIVGGGYFLRYSALPVSLAWDAFGQKNGVTDIHEFTKRIRHYRREVTRDPDPTIGCVILVQPFFLPRERWVPVPDTWKPNIVQGKGFDTSEMNGASLWQSVERSVSTGLKLVVSEHESKRYGDAHVHQRLGQGAFRIEVTEAYERRCAISGEKTLPVLQASHIKPYANDGPHHVTNGLCLRADMHLLFDQGLLTVTPELRVEVSSEIRERYENGRDYYAFHGKELRVKPSSVVDRPANEFLEWHNERVFVA
jgi:putative restriction endonuclease